MSSEPKPHTSRWSIRLGHMQVRAFVRFTIEIILTGLVVLMIMLGVSIATNGSPTNALAALQGRPILCQRTVIDLGRVPAGARASARLRVRNVARRHISIIGIQLGCGCMGTDYRPPTSLGFLEELSIPLWVQLPKETGRFNQSIRLHTNNPSQRFLDMEVIADVREATKEVASGR